MVIDDGTVTRLATSSVPVDRGGSEPALADRRTPRGLDVEIDDVTEQVAALALQGPTSARAARGGARPRRSTR